MLTCMSVLKSIDFEKPFDKVKHGKLEEILRKKKLDEKDIRIIEYLYWNQSAKVKTTDEIEIKRGVRQGCILSSSLFNSYSEEIFNEALEELDVGIKINGERELVGESLKDLQVLLEKLNKYCTEYGLKMNIKKNKVYVYW